MIALDLENGVVDVWKRRRRTNYATVQTQRQYGTYAPFKRQLSQTYSSHRSPVSESEVTYNSVELVLFNFEQAKQLVNSPEQKTKGDAVVFLKGNELLHRTVQIAVKISLWRCSRSLLLNNIEQIATKAMQYAVIRP